MSDSTDKKTESRDSNNRHENLLSRLNSIDKKTQEKRDNGMVDLDAMLDQAESSINTKFSSQDEEDAIDRLLMNVSFDQQTDESSEKDRNTDTFEHSLQDDFHDELDDFLNFEDFDQNTDINASQTQQTPLQTPNSAELSTPEDDLDHLLMNTILDEDELPPPPSPNIISDDPLATDKIEKLTADPTQSSSSTDELDDFFGLDNEFIDDLPHSPNSPSLDSAETQSNDSLTEDDDFPVSKQKNSDHQIADELPIPIESNVDADWLQDEETALSTDIGTFDENLLDESNTPFSPVNVENDNDNFLPETLLNSTSSSNINDNDLPESIETASEIGTDLISDDSDWLDLLDEKPPETNQDQATESLEPETETLISDDDFLDNVMTPDESPLNANIDDQIPTDKIDDLLKEAGFESDNTAIDSIDDNTNFDDLFSADDSSDDLFQQMESSTDNKETTEIQDDDFLLPDFDITAGLDDDNTDSDNSKPTDTLPESFDDTDFLDDETPADTFNGLTDEIADNQPINDDFLNKVAEDTGFNQFEMELEETKKQLSVAVNKLKDAENQQKKTRLVRNIAIGLSATSLSAAIGLGWMTYQGKTQIGQLTTKASTLESELAKAAEKNPHEELQVMRTTVEQLNQQIATVASELKTVLQPPSDLLDKQLPDIQGKQDNVNAALDRLQAKIEGGAVALEHSVAESLAEASTPATPEHEHPAAKTDPHPISAGKESSHETASKETVTHEISSTAKSEHPHETTAKTGDAHEEPAVKAKPPIEPPVKLEPAKPEPIKAKPTLASKPLTKEEPTPEPEKLTAPGKWSVNLVAVKQEWYAKTKAAEFARRGIYTDIIPVQGNHMMMYRLRVTGFKSKADAHANIARIKRTLGLDTVWVSDD